MRIIIAQLDKRNLKKKKKILFRCRSFGGFQPGAENSVWQERDPGSERFAGPGHQLLTICT